MRSTRSVEMMRPTLSLLRIALNASSAATSLATRIFAARRVPKRSLAERSTTSMTVISRSSTKTFTKVSFIRADTFQSMTRTSSPAWYGRTSRNASPWPLKLELYVPDSCSLASRAVWISMTRRAARSSFGITGAFPSR